MALLVAIILIGTAALISQRRRRGLEALLESALKWTEAERDDARRLAERRANTVAELGHEIRTPMTGIVGATQLLAQQPMSPVQRQLLSIQRQSAERLLNLVTAVLDEAKSEAGPAKPGRDPYLPHQLVAEVIELFAPQAHRKGIEIIWTADPEVPHVLLGDAMRIRQILSNLVSNAVKFTQRGVVHVHLLQSLQHTLQIEVRDTGAGLAAAEIDTIFERFVSAAPAGEQAYSTGLGLSICRDFARAMGGEVTVRSHPGQGSCFVLEVDCTSCGSTATGASAGTPEKPPPGRVWVVGASAPLQIQLQFLLNAMGTGCRFVDHLPSEAEWAQGAVQSQAIMIDAWVGHGRCVDLLPAILGGVRDINRRVIVINSVAQDAALGVFDAVWQVFRPPRWNAMREALTWAFSTQPEAGPSLSTTQPLRVMLVDDNPVNQIVGKAMLELIGAQVKLVSGGRAAVEAAQGEAFDLILMDLQMPEMDGLEATRRLRIDEARRAASPTPVIAVTGQAGLEVEAQCRSVGMDSLLLKPYTSSQLHTVVAAHCRKELLSSPGA
ncbi:MAG: ATP-binding protein [Ideonella sp.]